MIMALYFIGAIVFIIALILGFMLNSFWGFVTAVSGGLVSALLLFTLANLLEKQDYIINWIQRQDKMRKNIEKKTCVNCKQEYDIDYSSCPHCGNKD